MESVGNWRSRGLLVISFGDLFSVSQWSFCFRRGGLEFETRIPPSTQRAEVMWHVHNPCSMDVPISQSLGLELGGCLISTSNQGNGIEIF